MAGLTQARQRAILDAEFVSTDFIAYSINGTSEWAGLARTAIGAWTAASAADPSVKQNSGALVSAAATAAATVTHWAVFSASTAGTQKTDWTAVTTSKALGIGDTATWAPGEARVTMD